jgi:hypothetical protein
VLLALRDALPGYSWVRATIARDPRFTLFFALVEMTDPAGEYAEGRMESRDERAGANFTKGPGQRIELRQTVNAAGSGPAGIECRRTR